MRPPDQPQRTMLVRTCVARMRCQPALTFEAAATPERHRQALRRESMWVSRDHLEPRREWMDRAPALENEVRGAFRRLDRDAALIQRRHPVRCRVRVATAGRARRSEARGGRVRVCGLA